MTYDHLIGQGFQRWTQGHYTLGQLDFIHDYSTPSILYTGAYRAGKTEIASRAAIRHCLAFPTGRFGVFRGKLKSLRQSTLRTILELVHPSWVESWSNSELELRFINGASLVFLGCDFADRIGSIELTGGFIDEAHEVSPESYGMIVGRLSGPLHVDQDNLDLFPEFRGYAEASVDVRQLYLACNPKSVSHWLYKDFIDPDTRLPGRGVYSSNTITNRNLPESYVTQNLNQYARPGVSALDLQQAIQAIRAGEAPEDGKHLEPKLTPFGQRNLLGKWVALEGAIFEMDRATQVTKVDWEPERWYAAADFGFHHPRLVLAAWSPGKVALKDYWFDKEVDPSGLLDKLEEWDQEHGLTRVFLPPDQPGVVKMARQRLGASKVGKANNKVLSGIGAVQVAMNRGILTFEDTHTPAFELFWAEMEGYSWKQGKDGEWLDEPAKVDDHFCDSVRYLIYTLVTKRVLRLKEPPASRPEVHVDVVQTLNNYAGGMGGY